MKKLNEILKDNNIEEVKPSLDDMFGGNPLEDLFETFGKIFAPYEKRMVQNQLPTGILVQFQNIGGFVHVQNEKYKGYEETFKPLKK